MVIRVYKTTRNHRQLQRLIEEPEVISINKNEVARIPYKKHILTVEGDYVPSELAKAERKTNKNGNIPICRSTS